MRSPEDISAGHAQPQRAGLLHDVFFATAKAHAELPAVSCGTDTLSYAELETSALRVAHLLQRYGVRTGELVNRCPGVIEASVVSIPEAGSEPALFAWVVAARAVTEAALRTHCARHLPSYMIPQFTIQPSLPKTSTGKSDRQSCRRHLLQRCAPSSLENATP